jgi:hypothetical protein
MTGLSPSLDRGRGWPAIRPENRVLWASIAVALAALLYLSTFQTHINSSLHPFTTDVGEIQNALPRWGIIHHSSYPLYSAIGSMFVTLLRLVGVAPAAGASLYSLAWGLVTIALLVILAMEIGVAGPSAALGGMAAALSTSVWIDSSLAEVHTMTMALTVATLWFALRFGRSGMRRDLLWLTFVFSQGVFHQRSVILIAPAVLLLISPQLITLLRLGWRSWALVIGVALLAPLTYLYLPLRVWTGAEWVFGSPGTWDGFWTLFFDNRAGRVFDLQADWSARLPSIFDVLHQDLWLPLLITGLAGLWFVPPAAASGTHHPRLRLSLALTLVWMANFLVTILIWEGRVSDALLAAKLPVVLMAGLGLAFLIDWLWRRSVYVGLAAAILLATALLVRVSPTRSFILEITRDRSTQALVDTVSRVDPTGDRPATLIVPWGTDYWTLTYAQGYEGKLQGLTLVDHNARPQDILNRGDRLLALDQTFFVFPPAYYEERLGPLYYGTAAPGVYEMSPTPIVDEVALSAKAGMTPISFDLGNGIRIRGHEARWDGSGAIRLIVYWQAAGPIDHDYSVAVHLVAQDPPLNEADILDQADKAHPAGGWYPTTRWRPGEIVRDEYLLEAPAGSRPAAIRLAMYRSDPAAGFINTPWLSIPLDSRLVDPSPAP